MADVSPPVGLAAYAAGAIAGADPLKVGWQGMRYENRTALLPFVFVFNPEILMIDIGGVVHFLLVVGCAVLAMGTFVAASQNWLLTRNRWWETLALLLICFTLFRPGFWLDQLQAPFEARPAAQLGMLAETVPFGSTLRMRIENQSRSGDDVEKLVRLNMRSGESGAERLARAGLRVGAGGQDTVVESVRFGGEAAKYDLSAGDRVQSVLVPADRPRRYWFTIPALGPLAVIVLLQRRRQTSQPAPAAGRGF
jgi:hypothetical protein